MNEPNKASRQPPKDVIDQLVKTQYQKALNEAEQIKLKVRDLDHQADYAKKLLEYQARITANQPEEHRKTVTRYGYIAVTILLIFFGFITTCLYFGKEEFVKYFLQVVSYIVVSALSFYFGKKTGTKGDHNAVKEARVID